MKTGSDAYRQEKGSVRAMLFNAFRVVVDAVGDAISEGKMFTSYELAFEIKNAIPDFELDAKAVRGVVKGLVADGLLEGSGYTVTDCSLSVGSTGHARVYHPKGSDPLDYSIATGVTGRIQG